MSTSTTDRVPSEHRSDPGDPWRGFAGQVWRNTIDPRAFVQDNYRPYEGDGAFLTGATERTRTLWARLTAMFAEEGTALANVCHTPRRLSIPFDVTGLTAAAIINQDLGSAPPAYPA